MRVTCFPSESSSITALYVHKLRTSASTLRFEARSVPDGVAFLVPQNECIVTPNHFSGENDFSFALLNSRSCENDLFSLAEIHAHIVQKCLRAEVRRMCLSHFSPANRQSLFHYQ